MNQFLLLMTAACLALLRPLGVGAAEAPPMIVADGPASSGQFVAADGPAWKLRFNNGGTAREIAASDLVAWGGFVEPNDPLRIILAGGGLIVVDSVKIDKDQLHAQSQVFGAVKLPLELIAGVVFRPPFAHSAGDQLLTHIGSSAGQTDRVLLDNGDELTGTIASLVDATLDLETDAGRVDVALPKVAALIFNPTLVYKSRPSGLRALVGYRDGSRVTAMSLSAIKNVAQVKLAGGVELKSTTDAIVALQPLGGRAVYLSDLTPASYRHIPYLQLSWPYQADRSVLGGQLRAGEKLVPKGLGMHSPARITYDLGQSFRRFQAELAIDAEAGRRGSVVFRVFTDDGSGAWQERATSETIRGDQPPVPISVDLIGAKRLSLLVDYADRGDELDHADWLNARLIR